MSDPVISVENVGKAYRIWRTPAARLTSPLQDQVAGWLPEQSSPARWLRGRAARQFRDFWALRDVSFQVQQGEAIGIVGRNGSGKSTLLQIIAGTMRASVGSARTRGRVAALLELGAGFNPDFTGRENVYLNTGILGLTRAETDAKFDAIAAYADIGEFLDEPVKTYSSGMQMRLAFAVAAHVEAEALIIDEALGVGDARFQLKCARTIDSLVEQGRTLLIVSHDAGSIKRLCNRALLLEKGEMVMEGRPNTVINVYSRLLTGDFPLDELRAYARELELRDSPKEEAGKPGTATPIAGTRNPVSSRAPTDSAGDRAQVLRESERESELLNPLEFTYGGELGAIQDIDLRNTAGESARAFGTGDNFSVTFLVTAREKIEEPLYAMTVKDTRGQDIYVANTFYLGMHPPPIAAGETCRVTFRPRMNLMPGVYFISLGWTTFIGEELLVIHRRYDVLKFQVTASNRCYGIADLATRIEIEAVVQPVAKP